MLDLFTCDLTIIVEKAQDGSLKDICDQLVLLLGVRHKQLYCAIQVKPCQLPTLVLLLVVAFKGGMTALKLFGNITGEVIH